ncbi:hypothetical protein Bca101_076242 [Brassica carinata]
MMQPATAEPDPQYIGIRRILLHRKSESGAISRRLEMQCSPGNRFDSTTWQQVSLFSHCKIGDLLLFNASVVDGYLHQVPLSHQFDAESFSSSRVSSRRLSFSSSLSDGDHSFRRGGVTVLKFGHMSSDLLAYGASDGTLTVCSLSEEPSVLERQATRKMSQILTSRQTISTLRLHNTSMGVLLGSEDSNVYFYDLTKPKHTCVNKLQGHRFPVMCVAWNHGENFLASSDYYGIVIVWKRAKTSS